MSTSLLTPSQVNSETKASHVFESSLCGKCGGTGRVGYSYANGVCFGCNGGGVRFTKRGQAARAFYRQLAETPVEAVRPGDRVYMQGFTAGTFTERSRWMTVESVVDVAAQAAELGDWSEALHAAGSCSTLSDPEKIEAAAERGATLLPDGRGSFGCFEGVKISGTAKDGTKYGKTTSADATVTVALDPAVRLAILKTVAEYQENLTKAGKPRKGTRWAS